MARYPGTAGDVLHGGADCPLSRLAVFGGVEQTIPSHRAGGRGPQQETVMPRHDPFTLLGRPAATANRRRNRYTVRTLAVFCRVDTDTSHRRQGPQRCRADGVPYAAAWVAGVKPLMTMPGWPVSAGWLR